MEFFRNLTIARKLAIAFVITTLATLFMGGFSILRLHQANAQLLAASERYIPAVQHLDAIRTQLAEYRIGELSKLVRIDDPAVAAEYDRNIAKNLEHIKEQQALYEALPATKVQANLYQQMKTTMGTYFSAHSQMERAMSSGDLSATHAIFNEQSRPLRRELFIAMENLNDYVDRALEDRIEAAKRENARSGYAIAACMILLTLLSAALGFIIAGSIITPIREALRVVNDVANGRLDREVDTSRKDEIGQLLSSMQHMRLQLQAIITAQGELTHRHDAGEISFRIDESRFPGDYGKMVHQANTVVAQHIGVKMRVIEVMKCYASGDLSVDMDRLPGEKAAITQAMDATKANLSAINGEIKRLASAAAAGDFSQRGDADGFQHDFHDMVSDLNQLMQTTEENLGHFSGLLQAIASGDLTQQMRGEFNGIFASMRDDANTTVTQLVGIVSRIQNAASSINHSASEIAVGNNDLSRRTEQQAASLEETAASMEELTSTVRQNAEHAHQANQLAIGAHRVATEGGVVVSQVVSTMGAIQQSSKKIAEIISVIDGIAFQTNILALNAAVEAARAGEQGRGFAVVASEVRTLAQRSAGAAKEIKELIDNSVEKVTAGSALVEKAGVTMTEIVSSVERVTDIMANISTASREQSSGIEQVNQTVVQMDETTQQNAALVEEAMAAAKSMEHQAMQLSDAVARFKFNSAAMEDEQIPSIQKIAGIASITSSPARSEPHFHTNQKSSPHLEWAEF